MSKKALNEVYLLSADPHQILKDFQNFVKKGGVAVQINEGNACIINYKKCNRKAQRLIWEWVQKQPWRDHVLDIVFD